MPDEIELDDHERDLIAGVGLDPDNDDDVEFFYQQEREHEEANKAVDWHAVIDERDNKQQSTSWLWLNQ